MNDQQVSYVVTVFNKARFLPEVLRAIADEQRETGGEIILIDDGSTDESPSLLANFAAANPAVIVKGGVNRGVTAATNTGIALARCPYLRLIDADDVIVPGSTARLMQALVQTGCGFAYGRHAFTRRPEDNPTPTRIIAQPLSVMLTSQPFIPATTLGLTKTVQRALPLPEHVYTAQDFALGLRLAALTPFAAIDFVCCISPEVSGGLSARKGRMFHDTVLIARDEGERQNWPALIRRLALVRNAGRARNYLRRHEPRAKWQILIVSLLAVVTRLPFPWPYRRLMTYIADAYKPSISGSG